MFTQETSTVPATREQNKSESNDEASKNQIERTDQKQQNPLFNYEINPHFVLGYN